MANPALAVRAYFEPLRTLAFGSISGAYAAIGTALSNPSRQLTVTNNTDVLITFSIDGSTDHFVLLPGSAWVNDICSNTSIIAGAFMLSQNTIIYAKGAPTIGSVYISTLYGSNTN